MSKRFIMWLFLVVCLFGSQYALAADVVKLNSSQWLGNLKLKKAQLKTIKSAVEKALASPIDAEQQCGEVRLDCVVRAAREWIYKGDRYREIVINIHAVGHASNTIGQHKGKWPKIAIK